MSANTGNSAKPAPQPIQSRAEAENLVRHLLAAYDLGADKIYGHIKVTKNRTAFLEFCRYLRSLHPPEVRIEPDWDCSPAVSRDWLDAQVSDALAEVAGRRRRYRGGSRPVSPAGRVAIVVDQAIGPGHAMAGALRMLRQSRPSMIVAATPVASQLAA